MKILVVIFCSVHSDSKQENCTEAERSTKSMRGSSILGEAGCVTGMDIQTVDIEGGLSRLQCENFSNDFLFS